MEDATVKRIKLKIDRALRLKDLREAKEQYEQLADYLIRHDRRDAGIDAFQEATNICKRRGWKLDEAVLQRRIAEAYCDMGEHEEALKYVDSHLRYARETNNYVEKQRGYAEKGRIYFCWAELLHDLKVINRNINTYYNESLCAYNASLNICLHKLKNVSAREKEEMKARLFQNLGLVKGSLGRFDEAVNNFATAIQINKTQRFKQNLFWCYVNQGDQFHKAEQFINARTYSDLALKAACTKEHECEALKLKARCYLSEGELITAKGILREAYKKQKGKDEEVKEQLRITIFLCKLEDKIRATPETNYQELKQLFEKKGDAYCALKQYTQSINAYLKMLEFAQKSCDSDKDLIPCYDSLAQTYKDNGQYLEAVYYCQLVLDKMGPEQCTPEVCNTYLFLAELYEQLKYDYDMVHGVCQKALKIAKDLDDKALEIFVLNTIIEMQTEYKYFIPAQLNKVELQELKRNLDEPSEENNEAEDTPEQKFQCDVEDDELLSDGEELLPRRLRRTRGYRIRRNSRGENELHLACMRGNVEKVKQLIAEGHPVSARDLAGWTPLHEACNHGHIDVINVLLDNGANINDAGGEECDGITPLHDAAENGHYKVIMHLVEKGACTAVMTNQGETPLDILKEFRSSYRFDHKDMHEYDMACNVLRTNLDGKQSEARKRLVASSKLINKKSKPTENEVTTREELQEKLSATALYKSAIEGVRRRRDDKPKPKNVKVRKPALINEDEIVEDWLVNDMETETSPKRRKTQRRNGPHSSRYLDDSSTSSDDDVETVAEVINVTSNSDLNAPSTSASATIQRNSFNSVNEETQTVSTIADNSPQPTVAEQEMVNPTTASDNSPEAEKAEKLHKFKVSIHDEILLIPVIESEIKKLTVQWLIDAVVERYTKIRGKIPDILMMTGDNAIPSESDPLSVLVDETLKTRVLGFRSMNLAQSYNKVVGTSANQEVTSPRSSNEVNLHEEVAKALDLFTTTGDLLLGEKQLTFQRFLPVIDILRKEKLNVKTLDLSKNQLGDEIIDPLMDYWEKQSIERLYLQSNSITFQGIQNFSRRLLKIPEENLKKIVCLDLSFNNIQDEAADYLNTIRANLQNLEYFGMEGSKSENPPQDSWDLATDTDSLFPAFPDDFDTSIVEFCN